MRYGAARGPVLGGDLLVALASLREALAALPAAERGRIVAAAADALTAAGQAVAAGLLGGNDMALPIAVTFDDEQEPNVSDRPPTLLVVDEATGPDQTMFSAVWSGRVISVFCPREAPAAFYRVSSAVEPDLIVTAGRPEAPAGP